MEPQVFPEQPVPVALHTTTPEPVPLAENCTLAPGFGVAELGETISPEVAATIVAVALEVTPGAATDFAQIVTCAGLGIADGAV
jgi:hypothetical protein